VLLVLFRDAGKKRRKARFVYTVPEVKDSGKKTSAPLSRKKKGVEKNGASFLMVNRK